MFLSDLLLVLVNAWRWAAESALSIDILTSNIRSNDVNVKKTLMKYVKVKKSRLVLNSPESTPDSDYHRLPEHKHRLKL